MLLLSSSNLRNIMLKTPGQKILLAVVLLLLWIATWVYVPHVERGLTEQAKAVIEGMGLTGQADITFKGPLGTLTGRVKDAAQKAALVEKIEGLQNVWGLAVNAEGLRDASSLPAPSFTAQAHGADWTLAGEVGTQADKTALVDKMKSLFPAGLIEDRLKVSDTLRDLAGETALLGGLPALASKVSLIEAKVADGKLALLAAVKSDAEKASADAAVKAAFPSGGPSLESRVVKHPALQARFDRAKQLDVTGVAANEGEEASLLALASKALPGWAVAMELTGNAGFGPVAWWSEKIAALGKVNDPSLGVSKVDFQEDGKVRVHADVRAPATKDSITQAVKAAFGADTPLELTQKSPAEIKLAFSEGKITLSGKAADAGSRDFLLAQVRTAFPGKTVEAKLALDPNVEGLPSVTPMIASAGKLATPDLGKVAFSDITLTENEATLNGTVVNAEDQAKANRALAGLFQGKAKPKIDVLVPHLSLSNAKEALLKTGQAPAPATPPPPAPAPAPAPSTPAPSTPAVPWGLAFAPGEVTVSGTASTPEIKQSFLARIQALYPRYKVSDKATVAANGSGADEWRAFFAGLPLVALAGQAESLNIRSGVLHLKAKAASDEAKQSLLDRLKQAFGDRFNAEIAVAAPAAGAPAESAEVAFASAIIFFNSGQNDFIGTEAKKLGRVLDTLKAFPDVKLEVQGHTDAAGARDANLKLSQDRAASVREWLVSKGIAADRVTAKGFGPDHPVGDNATDAGKAANRRVEFRQL